MKKPLLVLALATSVFSPLIQAGQDKCESHRDSVYPVVLGACTSANGKSGYTVVKYKGFHSATVCWNVKYPAHRADRTCRQVMNPGDTDLAPQALCGSANGGCQISLESMKLNK